MQEDERFSFCWLANGCMCLLLHAIATKTSGNVWGFEGSGKENDLPVLKAARLSSRRQEYAPACESLRGERETEEHRAQCH